MQDILITAFKFFSITCIKIYLIMPCVPKSKYRLVYLLEFYHILVNIQSQ